MDEGSPGAVVAHVPARTFAALAAVKGGPIDEAAVRSLLSFIDERRDRADFRMLALLKLWLTRADDFPEDLATATRRTILGFKYWIDEPGSDPMCFWSENHQALFSVCEYLAGSAFPAQVFSNDKATGSEHRHRAELRLHRWLWQRFTYGFSEWLSPSYYEQDVAALTVLVDHAGDEHLADRATMVLDLLLLDMAMHRFEGHFVASSGRCHGEAKVNPARAEVNQIMADAFGGAAREPDLQLLGAVFLLRERYEVPPVLREIATSTEPALIKTSQGLDVEEAVVVYPDPANRDTTGMLLWGMEAFVHPRSIQVTMDMFHSWKLASNPYLSALGPFARVQRAALPALVRTLNPLPQGAALQRANVQTYRTADYLLSSAQHHQPGSFGDQQHIWHAALPGGIGVFGTHPGSPLVDPAARTATPSAWVGNGVQPDVAQDRSVLLALYDTRGRAGYRERRRAAYSHVHFPFATFDDTKVGPTWVAGRARNSFIGVVATSPLEMASETEVVQRGAVTGYVVILSDTSEYASFRPFVEYIKSRPVLLDRGTLSAWTVRGRYDLRRGSLRLDGRPVGSDYPRFDSPWVSAEREPTRIEVTGARHRLVLDWQAGTRVVS